VNEERSLKGAPEGKSPQHQIDEWATPAGGIQRAIAHSVPAEAQ
jgi:hypothetical protein